MLPNPPAGEEWFNPFNYEDFGEGYLPVCESHVDHRLEADTGAEYNAGTNEAPDWKACDFGVTPHREGCNGVVRVPAAFYPGLTGGAPAEVTLESLLRRSREVPPGFDWFAQRVDYNAAPMGPGSASGTRQMKLAFLMLMHPGMLDADGVAARDAFLSAARMLHETINRRSQGEAQVLQTLLDAR